MGWWEPVLPAWPERSPGPKPVSDRLCLQGILFVLHTGIPWQQLPLELGFGSGQTCWRRLERWQEAGVFDRLHQIRNVPCRKSLRSKPETLVVFCAPETDPVSRGGCDDHEGAL